VGELLAKPRTYGEVLEYLKIPEELPREMRCEMCGEFMYWVSVNDFVGFWVHKGESIKICASKNMLHPGHPLIRQNMKIYKDIVNLWNRLMVGG